MSTLTDWIGLSLELIYGKILGGDVQGGYTDGGKDIVLPTGEVFQVKSSMRGGREFLKKSIQFGKFIPLLIGEPGEKEEILESVEQYGCWVGKDEPGRMEFMEGVRQVRTLIEG
jgi:hypothetical protein